MHAADLELRAAGGVVPPEAGHGESGQLREGKVPVIGGGKDKLCAAGVCFGICKELQELFCLPEGESPLDVIHEDNRALLESPDESWRHCHPGNETVGLLIKVQVIRNHPALSIRDAVHDLESCEGHGKSLRIRLREIRIQGIKGKIDVTGLGLLHDPVDRMQGSASALRNEEFLLQAVRIAMADTGKAAAQIREVFRPKTEFQSLQEPGGQIFRILLHLLLQALDGIPVHSFSVLILQEVADPVVAEGLLLSPDALQGLLHNAAFRDREGERGLLPAVLREGQGELTGKIFRLLRELKPVHRLQ